MANISAQTVKELRDKTGAGMMDCKAALAETGGDIEAAVDWLRKKGLAKAAKKAGRVAAEGLIGVAVAGGLLTGFAAAQLIHDATGLPLWLSYGLAAGGLGAAAVALLKRGRDGFADLKPLPQTTAALAENVEWLADRLTPAQ